jgi:outer membrane protein
MRQRLFIGAMLGAFLAVMSAAVPARAEYKFAYVDVQRALNECDAGKRAKAEFQGKVTSLEGRLQRQQSEVQSLKDEMEKKGMLMNADQRQALQDKYMEKLKNFERDYKDSKDELQAKDQEITAKIVHDLAQVIRTIGERDNYTIYPVGCSRHRHHRPGDPQLQLDARGDRHRRRKRGRRSKAGERRSAGRVGAVGVRLAGGQEVDDLEVGRARPGALSNSPCPTTEKSQSLSGC